MTGVEHESSRRYEKEGRRAEYELQRVSDLGYLQDKSCSYSISGMYMIGISPEVADNDDNDEQDRL